MPVFLSTPHHYGNKDWGGKEYTFFHFAKAPFKADNTDKEDRIAHWYFSDIEPISGRVVRRARRLQWAFRLERTSLFPFLMYSQGYCKVPTNDFNENGYGCFCFIPAWWVDDEYVLDERGTLELYNRTLLTVPERVLNTVNWTPPVELARTFNGLLCGHPDISLYLVSDSICSVRTPSLSQFPVCRGAGLSVLLMISYDKL